MKVLPEILAEHLFLQGIRPAHIQLLADSATLVEFKKNEIVLCEGDLANRFYLIQSGRIALEFEEGESGPMLIQMIGPGDALGWSWLFTPSYWHFDARALEPVKAISFYGTRLREQCDRDHDFGYELMKRMAAVLIQRLQTTRKCWQRKKSGGEKGVRLSAN